MSDPVRVIGFRVGFGDRLLGFLRRRRRRRVDYVFDALGGSAAAGTGYEVFRVRVIDVIEGSGFAL